MSETVNESEYAVRVVGGELFVKRWTKANTAKRAPMLLLHDSIGCVEMWRQFPAALALQLRRPVIAYDRLGYGRSSARTDQPSVQFVSEEAKVSLPAIRDQLGFDTFLVFGHSVGGGMAVVIADRFQTACLTVITESAQAFVEDRTLTSIAQGKEKFSAPQQLAKLEKFHGSKARWVVDAWTDTWLSPAFRDWHLREELTRIRCPLLAIHGDKDEYGSTAFPDALTQTAGPSVKAVLQGCGHVPHAEQQPLVLNTVERFLTQFSLGPEAAQVFTE